MNYIGSKRRLAARIVPHIQEAIKTTGFSLYLEPFVGGANVIDKVDAPYRIGADNQRYLVALLSAAGGGGGTHTGNNHPRGIRSGARKQRAVPGVICRARRLLRFLQI